MAKRIILIGGAPTVGKSTIAAALGKHLDLPWISTDQVRSVMRAVVNRSTHPNLYGPEGMSAEEFLTTHSAEQIVAMEFAQADAAWQANRAFIVKDFVWTNGFIMEGVNIVPHLVARDFGTDLRVQAVFLFDHDEARMRHVIYTRGLSRAARDYADSVKEKEVAWAMLFNQRLEAEAKKHGFPIVEVNKADNDIRAVVKAIEG